MNILLCNDDGYLSRGINILKDKLEKYGKVVIVAPKKVMSAKSVSIIIGEEVEVKKVEDDIYYIDGTPADAVAFGLSSLNIDFDLVVSGCNDGLNVSYDTMYSGTIGACLQALTYRIPAIAVSCEGNFEILDNGHLEEAIDYILEKKLLSKEYLLNVNFPVGKQVNGIELTSLYYRPENTYYIHTSGDKYLATRNIHDSECDEVGTDVFAVYHDKISITKLSKSNFIKEAM